MDKNSNGFTVLFAVVMCVVLAVCLAATYEGLKDRIGKNQAFDKQKNVMIACGLIPKGGGDRSRPELEKLFRDRVRVDVLEVVRETVAERRRVGGEEVTEQVQRVARLVKTDIPADQLADVERAERRKPAAQRKRYALIYTAYESDARQKPIAYSIPISGYGLWSYIYGYLALEPNLNDIKGITFYQDGETPGLGKEVNNVDWQRQWESKQILGASGELVGVIVKKGTVDQTVPMQKEHMVDGLSGATITCNGVTRFVRADLETYEPYFKTLRN